MLSSMEKHPWKRILLKQDDFFTEKSSPEEHSFETGCSPPLKNHPRKNILSNKDAFRRQDRFTCSTDSRTTSHAALIPEPPRAATVLNLSLVGGRPRPSHRPLSYGYRLAALISEPMRMQPLLLLCESEQDPLQPSPPGLRSWSDPDPTSSHLQARHG